MTTPASSAGADPAQPRPSGVLLRWRPHTLKARIVLVAALLFLAGGAGITCVATLRLHADMEQVLSQQQLATTSFIARDIGSKLALRMEGLRKVASNIPPHLLKDRPALQRWLEDRRAIHTLFPTGLMIVPADGGAVLAETPILPTRPKSFTDRDWFIGAVTTREPYFSKPLITRATGEPALAAAVPLFDRHGTLLALVVGITPLRTPGFLDQITDARPGRSGSYELYSPRDGLFVLGSDQALTLAPFTTAGGDPLHQAVGAGERGVATQLNAEGVEELVASVDVPHIGWVLTARLPTTEAFAPVENAIRNTVLLAAAIGIPLILLLLLALGRLMRPLERLARQLQDMAQGQRAMEPVAVPRRYTEIAEVATAFNQLQHKLLAQEQRLAALARRDPLTGLANREPLNERLSHELQRLARSRKTIALLFLDLDGFKAVNDTYGHDVGDRLLCEVAERLEGCVRDTDMVARQGGDEFIILLTEVEAAQQAAERVAQACLAAVATPYRYAGLPPIGIGISIGIASLGPEDVPPESVATFIRRADAAMYQAKSGGRNRFTVAPPPTPGQSSLPNTAATAAAL
jgi:diguanylate cyclase (GGDEF)-like protein